MRKRFFAFSGVLIAVSAALAVTPPGPLPLKERVQKASHIFVGTAGKLRVIDWKTGHEVIPQPKGLALEQCAELQVRVDDVLITGDWHPKEPVVVRFGGGFFSVEDLRKQFVDKKLIYLTIRQESYFIPSYPWHLVEPVEKRAEIEGFIGDKSK